jgi:hypothetical protein
MGVESEIIKAALGNGLWAALFVYMLYYVLKTSGEREKRLIDCLDRLEKRCEIVNVIKDGVDRIERRLGGERVG